MIQKKPIDLEYIERYFRIEEDGAIWSFRKNKYLKPTFNMAGYLFVFLGTPNESSISEHNHARWYSVHRLVATKYLGQCPLELETSHKDGNKMNNHWSNLEYITHQANILKSYQEHGRQPSAHLSYPRKPMSNSTKLLMADAKKKRVRFIFDGMEAIFDSIDDAAQSLITYRKKIQRCIYDHIDFYDKHCPALSGTLSFVDTPI